MNAPSPAGSAELPAGWRSLARLFVTQARHQPHAPAMVDLGGGELSYIQALERAIALGRVLNRVLRPSRYVGLCVPPSVAGALSNLAVSLRGLVPVNLNYTSGPEHIAAAIRRCQIQQVITSRRVSQRFHLGDGFEPIYLEDIPRQVTWRDKIHARLAARFAPLGWLGRCLPGLRDDNLDDTAAVLFTSGTTGEPKGVVLTQRNLLSNVRQLDLQFQPAPGEVVLGILPFFHALGLTVTFWTVLCLGKKAVFHYNPLEAHVVGELCQREKVTLLFGTPSFLRIYMKRCHREQFATVQRVGLGAEKLSAELAQEMRNALGVEPIEGYGCTELSPVVSFNVDREIRAGDGRWIDGNKLGTVGFAVPGTRIKTVSIDDGSDLPRGAEGIVCVQGPQLMAGYLDQPDETAKVIRDGWYHTGDIGWIDDDGFLSISGRLSRFSKVGGEMVGHERVEELVRNAAGVDEQALVVTGVPDSRHGERLVVLYVDLGGKTPEEITRTLAERDTPRLLIPGIKDYVPVHEIPRLGTGKTDLGQVRRMAEQLQVA